MAKQAHKRLFLFLLIAISILVSISVIPGLAFARSYTMPQVDQDVTIEEDGSIHVVEIRRFDFDGEFRGVYWSDYLPENGEYTILSVGEVIDGELVEYERVAEDMKRVSPRTYYLEENRGNGQYYLELSFYKNYEETAFRIEYIITNAVTAYSDVAELYWQYIGPDWEVDSKNVNTRFHFANVAEPLVPGENVHAYGHGMLNGEVTFDGNDIIYTVPYVYSGNFAEARILFPLSYVPQMQAGNDEAYQSILSEEAAWADEANAKRQRARIFSIFMALLPALITIVGFILLFKAFKKYGKDYKADFQGKYFREKPSQLHPAILGNLWRGSTSVDDLSASILKLSDLGYIGLQKVQTEKSGFLGIIGNAVEDEYILHDLRPHESTSLEDPIDQATMDLLFYNFAQNSKSLNLSSLEDYARKHAESYSHAYKSWFKTVDNLAEEQEFFEPEGNTWQIIGVIIGVISFISFLISGLFITTLLSMPFIAVFAGIAVVLFIVNIILTIFMGRMSQSATNIKAKLQALRNWLQDFTLLNEAPPTHVKVWRELIVMATTLGVAEQVMDQLKTKMPEIYNDPGLVPMTTWYAGQNQMDAMSNLTRNLVASNEIARNISMKELASTAMSSSSGSGGGFSSGGGGGFGGGGGGAF
ncbi:MAG: DUF2207 domain-containing protein [Coriobacteriia bacterium]|nr:DUF2207 domain-containing protein [Coriobacteriia bacterium]